LFVSGLLKVVNSAAHFTNVCEHLLTHHKAFWDPSKVCPELNGVLEIFPFVQSLCKKVSAMVLRGGSCVQEAFEANLSAASMVELWSDNASKQSVQEYMGDLPWNDLEDWSNALKKEGVSVPKRKKDRKGNDEDDDLLMGRCVDALEKHYMEKYPDDKMQCYYSIAGSNAYRTFERGYSWVQEFVRLPDLQDYIPSKRSSKKVREEKK
jgi:hypothetical protein